LIRMVDASPKLKVAHYVTSVDEIRDLMYRGDADVALVIPKDFSTRLKRGHDVFVTGYVNAASMVSGNTASSGLVAVVQSFSAGVEMKSLMKGGVNSSAAMERFMPVKLDVRPMFNPSFNYANFMFPGLLVTIIQQVILLALALSFAGERESNTMPELLKITRNPLALMVGKSLPYIVVNFVVFEFYLRVLFPLNDVPIEGSWALTLPFSVLFIITIVFWGMWFSAICTSRLMATQVLMFVALPSFLLSGFTWPVKAMPDPVQWLAQLLPITHFVSAFRNLYLGGATWRYVAPNFAILSGFLVLNLVVSFFALRWLAARYPKS
jgi:ABC-2 type transport system permease protein